MMIVLLRLCELLAISIVFVCVGGRGLGESLRIGSMIQSVENFIHLFIIIFFDSE